MKKIWKTMIASALGLFALGAGVYALDGDVVATAADNEETNAVALTVGANVTEHATFGEAVTIAEEDGVEEAVITLLKNTSAEMASPWIYHSLTVDLAGYTLDNANISLAQGNNPTLTIEDSSEDKTGRINTVGGVVFSTVEDGAIIVNGGTFDRLDLSAGHDGNMTVTINDGYFESASIGLIGQDVTGSAEIKGGSFGSFYAQPGDNEITVMGGRFKAIYGNYSVNPDFLVSNIIPEGYKLFDEKGKAVDANVASLFLQSWVTASYHPTCSYSYYDNNEKGHWLACDCGAAEEGVEIVAHTPIDDITEDYHSVVCWDCLYVIEAQEGHSWENGACEICGEAHNCQGVGEDGVCGVCGLTVDLENMSILVTSGEEKAYYSVLQKAIENAPENATVTLLSNVYLGGKDLYINTPLVLDLNGKELGVVSSEDVYVEADAVIKDSVGGGYMEAGLLIEHSCTLAGGKYSYISFGEGIDASELLAYGRRFYAYDEATDAYVVASEEAIANGKFLKVVNECTHTEKTLQWNEETHFFECPCGWVSEATPHFGGEATCDKQAVCEVCEQSYGEALGHDYEMKNDETHHWEACLNCQDEKNKGEHAGGEATESEKAVCETCGKAYGELLPATSEEPTGSVENGGNVAPEKEGGCKSSVGGGFALGGLALLGLAFVRKRKEN